MSPLLLLQVYESAVSRALCRRRLHAAHEHPPPPHPHLTLLTLPRRRYNNMGRVIRGQRKGPGGIFKVRQQANTRTRARVLVPAARVAPTEGSSQTCLASVPSIVKPAAREGGSTQQDERGGGSTPGHARTTRCPRALDELSRRANKRIGWRARGESTGKTGCRRGNPAAAALGAAHCSVGGSAATGSAPTQCCG